MDYIIIRKAERYEEIPIDKQIKYENEIIDITRMIPFCWEKTNSGTDILYLQNQRMLYKRKAMVSFAAEKADVCWTEKFPRLVWEEGLYIERNKEACRVYYNEREMNTDINLRLNIMQGDVLLLDSGETVFKIIFHTDKLEIIGNIQAYTCHLPKIAEEELPFEDFPKYKRSPRLIKRVPEENISIHKIPDKRKMSKTSLAQIIVTPLVMLCITIVLSIVMKRGIYVIMSVTSTFVSIIASVGKYIHDKKDVKESNEKRLQVYTDYLLERRKKINEIREEEIEAYQYNYPSVNQIEAMISRYNSRIYERSINDDDFLMFTVGSQKDNVSFSIECSYDEPELEYDELRQEAKEIKESLSIIENKPVVVDMKKAHIGLVGEKSIIHEQLKLIIAQLAFFHSYHDLQIVMIYDSTYDNEFKWMRWYPHVKLQSLNMYGIINSEKMRDQVLGSIYQMLKERKNKLEENKKETSFFPHYVFIIDEPKLIMDHSIMEYLEKEGSILGFSIIYTTFRQANLPENIGTIVELNHSEEGTLLLNEKEVVKQKMQLNRASGIDFEMMARNLGVLEHEQGMSAHIPEQITFFDMYGIEQANQLNIKRRWKNSKAYQSLAVPLGARGNNDYLYLNLHEKAHGPHGLVAGTTGSGKSEIIQSYILSLAVNFHPYEVGFLLIDYKGGGMAGMFAGMPHLLGTITNLDGSESMRALASIKSELARRQRIFNEFNVNHINSYSKLFRSGEAKEPIPHLFLISDEFAELKKEQPEFMKELVSAARIGRSLGIHLILATQKPSGIVDDQIWTNSRFKLALKVQNESDSKEILKTPDAAFITQPGRAYLQVGNNEIYELFQSAWSGAAYSEEQKTLTVDNRVYVINDLGQGELLNGEPIVSTEPEQLLKTQLDVVVEELKKNFDELKIAPVRKPWLPPLPYQMVSPCTIDTDMDIESREGEERKLDLEIPIGMADIPEEQQQCEYSLNLCKDGNIAFFAASGYGKTTFLQTVILSLALKNSVDNLNFYVFDFGNNALIPMKGLPHVSDYITVDDNERMSKFVRIIKEEIQVRKKLLAEKMVQNFDVYNQTSEQKLKAIVVVVDNYDIVKELGMEVEDFFAKLGRDGAGLGIYMIVTASRLNGIKYTAMNNYKNKIAGYLLDATECSSLVGKTAHKPVDIEGRCLVKMNRVNRMQVYTMTRFSNEIEYNAGILKLIGAVQEMYPVTRAPKIPVLPERFTSNMLKDYAGKQADIYLGLHKVLVEVRGFLRGMSPFLILGDAAKGKTNLLKVIISQAHKAGKVYVFDSADRELYYTSSLGGVEYVDAAEDMEDFIEDMKELYTKRKEAFSQELKSHAEILPKNFYSTLEPCHIVIDDADDFVENNVSYHKALAECFKELAEVGVSIIVTMHLSKGKNFDELSKWFKAASYGIVAGPQGMNSIFPMVPQREQAAFGEGMLYMNGVYEKVLLPMYVQEEE